jgi:hypothetical protein
MMAAVQRAVAAAVEKEVAGFVDEVSDLMRRIRKVQRTLKSFPTVRAVEAIHLKGGDHVDSKAWWMLGGLEEAERALRNVRWDLRGPTGRPKGSLARDVVRKRNPPFFGVRTRERLPRRAAALLRNRQWKTLQDLVGGTGYYRGRGGETLRAVAARETRSLVLKGRLDEALQALGVFAGWKQRELASRIERVTDALRTEMEAARTETLAAVDHHRRHRRFLRRRRRAASARTVERAA